MTKKELTLNELKKVFPHLAQELKGSDQSIPISGVRSTPSLTEDWRGYNPDVIDFLRRCTTITEGLEIINYLESQQEITPNYAKKLRKQLHNQGIRSFGLKKEQDFYLKQSQTSSSP